MAIWLLVFVSAPIIEMYLLIRVGGYLGAWPTIGLVVLTAVVGIALLRFQGLATLSRGLRRLDLGEVPAREMIEGLLLAIAGVLLVTPGFVTDLLGFLLLWTPLRITVAKRLLARVRVAPGGGRSGGPGGGSVIIEGEFESRTERDSDDDRPPPLNSPR
jgi:UPF0716 protein FxsA